MNIRKKLSTIVAISLTAGTMFVVSQNISLSLPKSLGYQSATISGVSFSAGHFSAGSNITVRHADKELIEVPVDASFSAPRIGQKVCIHSSTQWFTTNLMHRFAATHKCAN